MSFPLFEHYVKNDWVKALEHEFDENADSYIDLNHYIQKMYANSLKKGGRQIFPAIHQIFNAFKFTPLRKVKVVLLGQDPYYKPGYAHGLSFSVKRGMPIPASLRNIFKEISSNMKYRVSPVNGYLKKWTRQGVLLLNTALTVEAYKPHSHHKLWESFSEAVFKVLNAQENPIVFILLGADALEVCEKLEKKSILDMSNSNHLFLVSSHPSPKSAKRTLRKYPSFIGSELFYEANKFLKAHGVLPINWRL